MAWCSRTWDYNNKTGYETESDQLGFGQLFSLPGKFPKGILDRLEGGCNEQTHRLASLAKASDITLSYLMLEIGLLVIAITKTHGIVIIYTGRCGKPVTWAEVLVKIERWAAVVG